MRAINHSMLSDKRPSFFKIILAGHSTQHLRIPPLFLKKITDEITRAAVLKGPSGRYWQVEVIQKNIGGVYLENGWKEFLNDNSLGDNEFLVFRYNGSMRFDVQIFDKSGCERANNSATTTHQKPVVPSNKRKRGRPRKYPEGSVRDRRVPRVPCREGDEVEIPYMRKIKTEETELDPQLSTDFEGNDFQRRNITKEKEMCVQTNYLSAKVEEHAICKLAEAFTSPFPFFTVSMRDYNVNKVHILTIPTDFWKKHLDKNISMITLRNQQGSCCDVKVLQGGSSRFLSGGWRAFAVANIVRQGDTCIFELVGKSEMQVHIFRVSNTLQQNSFNDASLIQKVSLNQNQHQNQ